jgi:hypothetical protein
MVPIEERAASLMDILRRSLEQLTSPICGACNVEMTWSRSALVPAEQAVAHVFICPRCNRVAETKTPVKVSKALGRK